MLKTRSIIFIAAIVSGFSVFINSFAVKAVPSALVFTTAKNIFTAILILSFIIAIRKWKELTRLSKKDWSKLFVAGLIGGGIPFLLFFKGLSISSQAATNGAFIQKTMFVWVAVISIVWLNDKISTNQLIGVAVILLGIILAGGLKSFSFGMGELYILMATILWSVEAIYVSRTMKNIDSEIAVFGRMFFGSFIMLDYLLFVNKAGLLVNLSSKQIEWTLITSAFLILYVLFYYKSLIKFKPAEVTTILTLAFPVTVILQNIYKGTYILNMWPLLIIVIGLVVYSSKYFATFVRKPFALE